MAVRSVRTDRQAGVAAQPSSRAARPSAPAAAAGREAPDRRRAGGTPRPSRDGASEQDEDGRHRREPPGHHGDRRQSISDVMVACRTRPIEGGRAGVGPAVATDLHAEVGAPVARCPSSRSATPPAGRDRSASNAARSPAPRCPARRPGSMTASGSGFRPTGSRFARKCSSRAPWRGRPAPGRGRGRRAGSPPPGRRRS